MVDTKLPHQRKRLHFDVRSVQHKELCVGFANASCLKSAMEEKRGRRMARISSWLSPAVECAGGGGASRIIDRSASTASIMSSQSASCSSPPSSVADMIREELHRKFGETNF